MVAESYAAKTDDDDDDERDDKLFFLVDVFHFCFLLLICFCVRSNLHFLLTLFLFFIYIVVYFGVRKLKKIKKFFKKIKIKK